jgi:hypothetical protein
MIKLNYDKFTDFYEILERRLNASSFDFDEIFNNLNANFNKNTVKNELKKIIKKSCSKEPLKIQNAQIVSFASALMNYLESDYKKIKGYTTLTSFCKDKEYRPANIKKLLQDKGYLIKDYSTEKSLSGDNLYLTVKAHNNRTADVYKIDLIFLWKESFLCKIVEQNKEIVEEDALDYKYRTPRTLKENLNEINKYAKPLYDSEFIGTEDFESADYCGEYPYMDLIVRMVGYDMSPSAFSSFVTLLTKGVAYKESLITNTALLKKFLIQKNMLFRYLANYEKYYI